MDQCKVLQKIDAALIQLEAAVAAYEHGQDLVAITLAGAAEEILGKICQRNHISNAVEKIARLPAMSQIPGSIEDKITYLNRARNNLKHANDPSEDSFEISPLDPFVMIARAIGNARLLDLDLPDGVANFSKKL